MENKNFIDIDEVIASKSPKLLKVIPQFLRNYLKRIVHQVEINEIIEKYGDKEGVEFIDEVLRMMNVAYTVDGLGNIDANGRYLFASNHPLGGLDGMILIHLLGQKFESVKFPVNDLLMHVKQLQSVFLPVNKHGAQLAQNARLLENSYASSTQILYFPAGLCSRRQKGEIADLEWKKSFITKSVKHHRDVVPVYFSGQNSNFFYNLAKLRTFLKIKVNLEMLFLVDEMFKQKEKNITVRIGQPIPFQTFNSKKRPAEWAKWVKNIAYQMQPKV